MDLMDILLAQKTGSKAPVVIGGAVIDDTTPTDKTVYSSTKTENLINSKSIIIDIESRMDGTFWTMPINPTDPPEKRPTSNDIINLVNTGSNVRLHFVDTITNTGDQLYNYETTLRGVPYFRRNVITKDKVSRINIGVQFNGEIKFEEVPYAPEIIQQLEDNKAEYTYKVVSTDKVSQSDAREVLTYLDQYDGKLIEFLTNGENPSKCVATGRTMTDVQGNTYLITFNLDGTTTVWSRDSYEKHNFECRSHINEPMVDLDNYTIDHQGDAPFMASVQNAINKPGSTSNFGIITVLAYSVDKQIQLYRDIENGKKYRRLVTGTADKHSFGIWVDD